MSSNAGPDIVQDGLILCLDAGDRKSYPGSGTTWTDRSGKGNNGTLTNGPTFSDNNGGTIVFDGANDTIPVLNNSGTLLADDITQEAWVKTDDLGSWRGIISNMDGWGTGFSLQIGSIQNIAAMVSGDYLKTSWLPLTGEWYHIAATHRSSDNLNVLYVNGVAENQNNRPISYDTNTAIVIGVFYTPSSLRFSGEMGLVRTYDRALTADEVLQNYQATKSRFS